MTSKKVLGGFLLVGVLCSQHSCAAFFLFVSLVFTRALYNKTEGRAGGEKTDLYNGKLLTYANCFCIPSMRFTS